MLNLLLRFLPNMINVVQEWKADLTGHIETTGMKIISIIDIVQRIKMKYVCYSILITTLCFVLYSTLVLDLNDNSRILNTGSGVEQLQLKKCFKITWNNNTFGDFIRRRNTSLRQDRCTPECRGSPCNHFMELKSPGGRTGNQLFQIAALFGISFDNDYIPIINPTFPLLKYFDLPNVFMIQLENSSICTQPFPGIYKKCSSLCKDNICKNKTIQGFFQSWKYFKNSSDIIRTVLEIRPAYMRAAKLFLDGHKKVGLINICIHVRRTDMATDVLLKSGFSTASIDFIYKAIQYCEANFNEAIFFVLSDDIKWCKENINRDVKFSIFEEPGYDLALMSLCDHVVITAGSFGWWGAWLSNRTAVYFNGFLRPGSLQDKHFLRDDYYPPNWIGLS